LEIYNEKILIVDDELSIRQILETRLSIRGYNVILAANGEEALYLFRKESPDLVILDLMLPKIGGYEVCSEIRRESQIPIIMLTALGDISDRVMGLELGADDYVIKPFSPKELEARIRSVLRRVNATNLVNRKNTNQSILQIGTLAIDTNKRQVFKGSERIKLTGMEFNLLELLVTKAGERLSRSMILDRIWGYTPERFLDTRVVDVHISRLRSKLEEDPSNPDLIITARGTGYMFQRYQNINQPFELNNL
jgi:OmpR family response regulator RpaB